MRAACRGVRNRRLAHRIWSALTKPKLGPPEPMCTADHIIMSWEFPVFVHQDCPAHPDANVMEFE